MHSLFCKTVTVLCRVNRCDEKSLDLNAFIEQRLIVIVAAFKQQLNPLFGLRTFLERDLELSYEVSLAMGIERFTNISTDACS